MHDFDAAQKSIIVAERPGVATMLHSHICESPHRTTTNSAASFFRDHMRCASARTLGGEYEKARVHLQKIIETITTSSGNLEVYQESLELLSLTYAYEAKWEEAEQTLERLNSTKDCGHYALQAMHLVARAHLKNKRYANAQKWGTLELEQREKIVLDPAQLEQDLLYHLSRDLLAEISEAESDLSNADMFRSNQPNKLEGSLLHL